MPTACNSGRPPPAERCSGRKPPALVIRWRARDRFRGRVSRCWPLPVPDRLDSSIMWRMKRMLVGLLQLCLFQIGFNNIRLLASYYEGAKAYAGKGSDRRQLGSDWYRRKAKEVGGFPWKVVADLFRVHTLPGHLSRRTGKDGWSGRWLGWDNVNYLSLITIKNIKSI